MTSRSAIYVVKLLTDDELLLNVGTDGGAEVDQLFRILDPMTMDVKDPFTGESLGSVERVKAKVRVVEVGERVSIARVHPGRSQGLSSIAQVLSGAPRASVLSGSTWPDGVAVGDPAVRSGRLVMPQRPAIGPSADSDDQRDK